MLLIEHDMDFVFKVADRMTVMVEGAVLAAGKPAGGARQHGGADGLSRGATCDACSRPADRGARPRTPTTARATSCAASRSRSRAGETLGLMGRNGMGKTTLIRTHHGAGARRAPAACWSTART